LLGDQTLFRSARRLRGGEVLRCEGGQVVRETYWRYAPGSAVDRAPSDDLGRELGRLVGAATARHLGDPERTILFLSGGADSRGILGGALAAVGGRAAALNTVSWGADEGPADSDVAVAAAIARGVGTNHRFIRRQVEHYRESFTRVNRLVDALSEIAAFHPHEHQIMADLRAAGFERALRGDEVFGWSYPARTLSGALALVKLRRLREAQDAGAAIRPEQRASLDEASDRAIDAALDEVRGLDPNQAKDCLYFAHRLQCYLHPASYYKQVELDQRNVLLDEPILDFLSRVPEPLRFDKWLYRDAMARTYPELARFPSAGRDNLENWTALLAADTPVRAYALEELSDRSSGIWEYLDPAALRGMVEALARTPAGSPGPRSRPRIRVRPLARRVLETVAPGLAFRIQTRRYARSAFRLGPANLVLRAMVLKDWHDTFVAKR
jgi:asparagine synthetase B (glutamine-hydrolysing)